MSKLKWNGIPYYYPDHNLEEHYWIIPICLMGKTTVKMKPAIHVISFIGHHLTDKRTTYLVKEIENGWSIQYEAYGNIVVNTRSAVDAIALVKRQVFCLTTGVEEVELYDAKIEVTGSLIMIDDERLRQQQIEYVDRMVKYETE
jgi:hypothetical protein